MGTVLLVIVVFIVLIVFLASLTPTAYTIERRITINQPNDKVFNFVKLLEKQDQYNKWVMTDPNITRTYKGTDGETGATVAWESKNSQVGKGEQEITAIKPGSRIDYEIRFEKPFKGTSTAYMTTLPMGGGQTAVNWVMNGKMNLFSKVLNLFLKIKKMLGKDMAISLDRLKAVLEK